MFDKEVYLNRRENLKKLVGSGLILIHGSAESPIDTFANSYHFRQNSIFSYFTGINSKPSVTLVIDVDSNTEVLFADDFSLEDQIWTGPTVPFNETAELCGITNVKASTELEQELSNAVQLKRTIHYPPSCRAETLIEIGRLLGITPSEVNKKASELLIDAVISLREVKSDIEISEIESALDISFEIYSELLKNIKPGYYEKDLLGLLNSILTANGSFYSFPPIVTVRGEVLHNLESSNMLEPGKLILIDSGAISAEGYSSDITRTYPVSGTFTAKQKDIYQTVLDAQRKGITESRPGVPYRDVHLKSCEVITEGLKNIGLIKGSVNDAVESGAHALFMPHGLGHMMGIDDHDMELLGEDKVGYGTEFKRSSQFGLSALRLARTLKPGHVITVEPGIYFIPGLIDKWRKERKLDEFINYDKLDAYMDFGGIRIEDDLVICESGNRVLGKPIPKEITQIEDFMKGAAE